MKNIKLLLDKLKAGTNNFSGSYFIPGSWNVDGFRRYSENGRRPGEIDINPYSFISFCIESQILEQTCGTADSSGAAVGSVNQAVSTDLIDSTIYGMFPRAFTAWDHYGKDVICGGTFLKAICRLPYLKHMGVDIIYLLPVFKCSSRYKKGELGSPYSIKNFYKLDPALHDDLLGEYSEELLEIEFRALVEACHALEIKVMVDFAFRTISRDNDLIREHPEWFYWINTRHNETFRAPFLDDEKKLVSLNRRLLAKLYRSEYMKEYLSMFTLPPSQIDPGKWERLSSEYNGNGEFKPGSERKSSGNILELIEKEYGITTVPGFSDVLNDPQPPWTDVTYLKLYNDINESVLKYIPADQPPYISQDGVSLNSFPGVAANNELWEYIAGVIPFYREKFGIDGARIDMGHALPPRLNKMISERIKNIGGDFILWSEEFDPAKAEIVRKDGFHFISGYTSTIYKEIDRPSFNRRLFKETLMRSELPVTGAVETPDTPRAAFVHPDLKRIEHLIMLNSFLPNAIPFINNGFEVMERQPMNLGLDNSEAGRFVLDKDDPMYGRLAFFDNYRMHWLNSEGNSIRDTVDAAAGLGRRFSGLACRKEFYRESKVKNSKITFVCYYDKATGRLVFLAANRSMASRARLDLSKALPESVAGIVPAAVAAAVAGTGTNAGAVRTNGGSSINGGTANTDGTTNNGAATTTGIVKIAYEHRKICESNWDTGKVRILEPGDLIIGYFGF